MTTYSEKLKDPRWQKKRLEIFERDNFCCMMCYDDTNTLNVHHIRYEGSNPWDTDNKYLITLCQDCHKDIKESDQLITDLIDSFATTFTYDAKYELQLIIQALYNNHYNPYEMMVLRKLIQNQSAVIELANKH